MSASVAKVPGFIYFAPHALMVLVCVSGNFQIALGTGFDADFGDIYGSAFLSQVSAGGMWFAAIVVGAYLFSLPMDRRVKVQNAMARLAAARANRAGLRGASVIGFGLLAALVVVDGGNFIQRESYIAGAGLAGIFIGAALMSLPIVAAMQKTQLQGFLLLAATVVVAFSNATRVGALIPLIYLATRFLWGKGRVGGGQVLMLSVASVLLYGLALTSRGIWPHGLLAYTGFYAEHPDVVFYSLSSVLSNFSSNYVNFLATLAVHSNDFNAAYLAVIVDPRSGAAAGWNDISANYRIHAFVPYSGYGEMAQISYLASALFMVGTLLFYNHLTVRIWRAPSREKILHILALFSLLIFFVLMYSYNARSGFRWFYLALALFGLATGLRFYRSWLSYRRR